MPYIGNPIYQAAFVTDQFSGTGSQTAYTMSVAPAGTSNVLVVVSGVVQDPSTYSVVGNTLTFSAAPPSGTGNISCRYLGVPASGVTTTAYRTVTEFTATAGQTTFTPASYNVGFINVYRNGVLLGSADYTATNGTTVVLATGATAGDLVTVESFLISSVSNAISNTAGSVSTSNIIDGGVTAAKMAASSVVLTSSAISGVLPEANGGTGTTTGYYGFKNRIINGAMGIWQRGTSSTTTSAGYYTADRWATYFPSGSGTVTQDSSLVPSGFQYGLRFTSGATGSACNFYQTIETKNCYDLAGQNATVSAYVAGTAGQTAILNILYSTTADAAFTSSFTIVNSVNITLTGTPTKYSVTGAIPSNAQTIQITLTPATMSSGQYVTFTGVQLEKGSTATSFDYRPYGTELALCQRYCFKMSTTSNYGPYGMGHGVNTTNFRVFIKTAQTMRSQPTLSFSAANTFQASFGNAVTLIQGAEYGVDGFSVGCDSTGISANGGYLLTSANNTTSYILASSEL